ncbi:MAG: hypothetical protein HOE73_06895 [Bacteroidetes Order II. Incertae sedis bacterium]|jgi:hypothetical protein|nr:hypothetical protein [Bacteroidetes Order II. bacterium]MBT6199026.1 hypothetical protein [Bacteroidetes Order II. bacterium]
MIRRTPLPLLLLLTFQLLSCQEDATTAPELEESGIGSGTWRVPLEVTPGRYYTDPSSGCYFERLSGFGGALEDIIANEFIGFDPGQWIVDILASDVGFSTTSACGRWRQERQIGLRSTISPGTWEVRSQVALE